MFWLKTVFAQYCSDKVKIKSGNRQFWQTWATLIAPNLYLISILGICPGDKVPTLANPLFCACPPGSIQLLDDRCAICEVGEEVANEDQTECVGMFE